jgi:predicted ArsR family transcriptional regulator
MRKPKTLEEWQRYFAEAKTAGKTRKQMADELGIATSAIGYHMGKLRKTGIFCTRETSTESEHS